MSDLHVPAHPVRFVTAASLFDGHDAAINIMRRILQRQGAEVVHLGHNRSVDEVVAAAIQEDAQGVAISSYQGGHIEYFSYLVELLHERGAGHIRVYGGGGGVIVPREIELLHERGVARIFSPEDGQRLGLPGMINLMIRECDVDLAAQPPASFDDLYTGDTATLARTLTLAETGHLPADLDRTPAPDRPRAGHHRHRRLREVLAHRRAGAPLPARPGGQAAHRRARRRPHPAQGRRRAARRPDPHEQPQPARASSSGRWPPAAPTPALPERLADVIAVLKAAGFDLVIVETPGIGQGDAAIVPFVDRSLYVMTPEFGAASQLEKIDMLDFADAVAINKFERRGAEDARRDVGRQLVRNREEFGATWEDMPVFGTSAATFNDEGVTALYQHLRGAARRGRAGRGRGRLPRTDRRTSAPHAAVIPPGKVRYLADVAETVRDYHDATDESRRRRAGPPAPAHRPRAGRRRGRRGPRPTAEKALPAADAELLDGWAQTVKDYAGDELVVRVRDKELHTALTRETLSGSRIPRVALPRYTEDAELLRFLRGENLPGPVPVHGGRVRASSARARTRPGCSRARATRSAPTGASRCLSADSDAKRLSTAFDSVTLYGRDPDTRPDVYGKVGTSGVSIATLEDMKVLYGGFDLCSPTTSVSMTINGPAPTILAYYLNTAIDQRIDAFRDEEGREPDDAEREELDRLRAGQRPRHGAGRHPQGGPGPEHLHLLHRVLAADDGRHPGVVHRAQGAQLLLGVDLRLPHRRGRGEPHQPARVHPRQRLHLRRELPRARHGHRRLRAQPVVLLLQRDGRRVHGDRPGGPADLGRGHARALRRQRAQRRSSSTTCRPPAGRCTRRRWTSTTSAPRCRRSARSTTTRTPCTPTPTTRPSRRPTEESVRRAMAIQMIINREWGLSMNENPLQGSFVIEELTDLVEEAVLAEFDRIAERGGVLGAMETGYQRGRIQDESMLYEQRKHDGSLPIIGVNTFVRPESDASPKEIELARATEAEKQSQLDRLADFQARHAAGRPGRAAPPAGRRHRRGQRVRRADEGRAGVLARPAHRRVLRGRRPVPAQHVGPAITTVEPAPPPSVARSAHAPSSTPEGSAANGHMSGRKRTACP